MKKGLLLTLTMLLAIAMDTRAQDFDPLTTPLTIEAINAGSIEFDNKAAGPVTYVKNSDTPVTIASGESTYISFDAGDVICFYGDNASYGNFYRNQSTCIGYEDEEDYYIYGNIMSLVSSTEFATATTLTAPYAFANMFYWSYAKSHPTKALVLPATTLSDYCYYNMFNGCDISTAPTLPAPAMAKGCYSQMFYRCNYLTTAPGLPATTLAEDCYYQMFYECSNLTTASELPATTMAKGCYSNMFYGCKKLTTAPALASTTLAERCYNGMFANCELLTTPPALPATTLMPNCYNGMFSGCKKLASAPELPASEVKEGCYCGMFKDCMSLTTAPTLPATTMANSCYADMFNNTRLTTAPALPATTLAEDCYKSMFEYCIELTTAPALPAITLAEGCYESMFEKCWKLTTAPDLPAPKLTESCYARMFVDCELLTAITCLATDMLAYYCTGGWIDGVGATGTFTKAPGMNWPSGMGGIPAGWTVAEAPDMMIATTALDDPEYEAYPRWQTYYNSAMSYEAEAGTKVYTASLSGSKLTFTEVADRIVRAGQAVIMASNNAFVTMTPTTAPGTDSYYAGNSLQGSDNNVLLESSSTYYGLADLDCGLGFYKVDPYNVEYIPAHRAYIKQSGAGVRFFGFDYGENTTDIGGKTLDKRQETADYEVYNLQGRRVKNPVRGLYIVNGKKSIVK